MAIFGTPLDDNLPGTAGDDEIFAGAGNDSVTGGQGDDSLNGESGNDTLDGGEGHDRLFGGDGNDSLDASGGSAESQGFGDQIRPGLGANTIVGHAGLWAAGGGVDLIYGDLTGVGGLTITIGMDGTGTVVSGTPGLVNDTFTYVNFVEGSQDGDLINGSDEDRFEGFAPLGGADTVNGGGGYDELNYSFEADWFGGVGGPITVNVAAGTVIDTQGNTDVFSGIEQIRGSQLGDLMSAAGTSTGIDFRGENGNDTLIGGDGNDRLRGDSGDDSLDGGDGHDNLLGGVGNDTLDASGGSADTQGFGDFVAPGLGADVVLGHAGLWAMGEGIDLGYGDVSGVGGLTITIGVDGSGTVESGTPGLVDDTFTYANYFIGSNDGDLFIGSDEDQFQGFVGMDGADTFHGGDGFDEIAYNFEADSFDGPGNAVTVDVAAGTATDTQGNTDTFTGIEQFRGSQLSDMMTAAGTSGDISFRGENGDDTLIGGDGNDRLRGDAGDDTLIGGGGRDRLRGGSGDDLLDASGGSVESQGVGDVVTPGLGADTILGHAGLFAIDEGIALIYSNLSGVGGLTITVGANGTGTVVSGIAGLVNDTFTYATYFEGSKDGDLMIGSDEDQTETFSPSGGADTINGGGGFDQLDYRFEIGTYDGSGSPVSVDMATQTVTDTQGNTDVFTGIEGVIGSQLGDVMTAAGTVDGIRFRGENGDDTLTGGDGDDTLRGDSGDDRLDGGSGDDRLEGGDGDDGIKGGDGDDYLEGGEGNDRLPAGAGNDVSFGGDGDDRLGGGDGNDYMDGGNGNDGGGAGPGNDTVLGGAGNDTFNGGYGRDSIDLGDGDDRSGASFGNDTMNGGAGNDLLTGGDGNDLIFGDAGNDTINSGFGEDTVSGGGGADLFIFNALFGGGTTVITDFEDGIDTLRVTGLRNPPDPLGRLDITDTTYEGEAAAMFSYGDHTVIVVGATSSDLTEDDFLFT